MACPRKLMACPCFFRGSSESCLYGGNVLCAWIRQWTHPGWPPFLAVEYLFNAFRIKRGVNPGFKLAAGSRAYLFRHRLRNRSKTLIEDLNQGFGGLFLAAFLPPLLHPLLHPLLATFSSLIANCLSK